MQRCNERQVKQINGAQAKQTVWNTSNNQEGEAAVGPAATSVFNTGRVRLVPKLKVSHMVAGSVESHVCVTGYLLSVSEPEGRYKGVINLSPT